MDASDLSALLTFSKVHKHCEFSSSMKVSWQKLSVTYALCQGRSTSRHPQRCLVSMRSGHRWLLHSAGRAGPCQR